MKVDYGQVVMDLTGEALQDEDGPVTVGRVVANALLAGKDREQVKVEEHVRRYEMARRAMQQQACAEEPEDVTMARDLVAARFPTKIAGPTLALLKGDDDGVGTDDG